MFGRGKHDDQVDALSYLGLILDKMVEGPTVKEVQEEEYEHDLRGNQESPTTPGNQAGRGLDTESATKHRPTSATRSARSATRSRMY